MAGVVAPTLAPSVTAAEALDRARLLIDLDEATDPEAPPTTLLVAGFPRPSTVFGKVSLESRVDELAESIAALLDEYGSVYRTRANEVCALIDVREIRFVDLIAEIAALVPNPARRFALGFAELPREAWEATAALSLADSRRREADQRVPRAA